MSEEIEVERAADLELESRPWAFLPGDRVLCMVPLPEKVEMLAGTVSQIRIPGPITPHKVVQVTLDEDSAIKISWWDPERIEHLNA